MKKNVSIFILYLIEDGRYHHIVCIFSLLSGNCHLDMEDARKEVD